jgi:subtilisin family serine protease
MPRALSGVIGLGLLCLAADSRGADVNGARVIRILGPRAGAVFAPASGLIGALAKVPDGQTATELGLDDVAPGIGRLRGPASAITAFADAHPDVHVEVVPPLHTLLDKAGVWTKASYVYSQTGVHAGAGDLALDGKGAYVGVADTGIDITHPDLRNADGSTRIAWLLDLSLRPTGLLHADLEGKYGGAVLDSAQINQLLSQYQRDKTVLIPQDEVGHGTHVASIAVGNGGGPPTTHTLYKGVAPGAGLIVARVTRDASEDIASDDLTRGVQFIFDRADADKKPVAANMSLGSDFGPHDGTMLWEQTLASFVGPNHPGHALVAAAGNSGSIVLTPIHQSVHVPQGTRMRVPIATGGATSGTVSVWLTMREGASISVGLDGPDGEWVAPVGDGEERGHKTDNYSSGVVNGSSARGSQVPQGSHGANIIWSTADGGGQWPAGDFYATLEGHGTVDLFVQGAGYAQGAGFTSAVREGTVNLPATHPGIIGVGCTVNRPRWTSIGGAEVALRVPLLDGPGGLPAGDHPADRTLTDGEVCWFSSAGPTVTGVPKPEISAPGGNVIAALSAQAAPGSPASIFTHSNCPPDSRGNSDPRCFQIDERHAVALGTSMSAPFVAGAVALLFQRDPTLTQDKILAALQAGAHTFRGSSPFEDQNGPGELDVIGALDALDDMNNPTARMPVREKRLDRVEPDPGSAPPDRGRRRCLARRASRVAGACHRACRRGVARPSRRARWF